MEHRTRLIITAIINLNFLLTIGLVGGIIGPTLLDMKDIYGTTVDKVSFMFMMGSTGSITGSFITGFVMDKFPRYRCLLLFAYTLNTSLVTALMPFMSHLSIFFFLSFLGGFSGGSLDMGGNVFCLHVWRGLESGPYMHSIHFSFAIGAFLGPLLAVPFLGTNGDQLQEALMSFNETTMNQTDMIETDTQITIFYPLVGALALLPGLGYLYYGIQDLREQPNENQAAISSANHGNESQKAHAWKVVTLLGLVAIFFFLYVGVEVTFGTFLTTFAVESDLQLTKPQGADLTAIFWGFFALMRFLSIFAAIKLNPAVILVFSFGTCLLSSAMLSLYGDQNLRLLQLACGGMGVGTASIFATGILWLEQHVVVTNRIGALVSIAASLGPDIFPVIVGQYIVAQPMVLMHVTALTLIGCVLIFIACHFLARSYQKFQSSLTMPVSTEDDDGFETIPLNK
ncbi:hypothetical protein TCAL_09924 [Tigriopus californicus]|uniref:Major facilitator superfamily (MFS) profile domain-containing protein n=1 Tax=Tigriopus californicus TaxID=6832 RepID=A0A553NND9_TIGCA|nr:sodium-dependent glucose transporter 1C-like [Tigriopus californicus]TRY66961.1 hypothetical protein TCAL_09924 [Tigriopus californicus]|eukprot:TCALIF_09924-PA protein Name:"Similar to naglt1 Sodium-dependent glucose transporter 1 (Danio rerio)" AED:0.27 eAED:0.27 QI:117/1/1/1/1/1/4/8/454